MRLEQGDPGFTQCRYNVGPASATLVQHCTNIGSTSRVCNPGSTIYPVSLMRASRFIAPQQSIRIVNGAVSVMDHALTCTVPPCKVKRRYLLTCKVIAFRFCKRFCKRKCPLSSVLDRFFPLKTPRH